MLEILILLGESSTQDRFVTDAQLIGGVVTILGVMGTVVTVLWRIVMSNAEKSEIRWRESNEEVKAHWKECEDDRKQLNNRLADTITDLAKIQGQRGAETRLSEAIENLSTEVLEIVKDNKG